MVQIRQNIYGPLDSNPDLKSSLKQDWLPASTVPSPQQSLNVVKTTNDHRQSSRRLLIEGVLGWLCTIIIIATIIATLRIYESLGSLTARQKDTFNGIITVESLILALYFFSAFKDVANDIRWRILKQNEHCLGEIDLILGLEKWTNVFKLATLAVRSRNVIRLLLCIAWLGLMVAAQISVSLINQTYTVVDGEGYNGTYTVPNEVTNISRLNCYYQFNTEQNEPFCGKNNLTIAHQYGLSPATFDCGPLSNITDYPFDYPYYCRRDKNAQEFGYRFREYNPKDIQRNYPRFTSRYVTASSGPCFKYSMSSRETLPGAYNYTYTNGTFTSSITIRFASDTWRGTTYILRDPDPQSATRWACGPRCMWIWAHRRGVKGRKAAFFECPITVDQVVGAGDTEMYQIPDDVARQAASSIASSGVIANHDVGIQTQLASHGNPWDIHNKTADEVGANMAEYAIRSIATMAQINRPLQDMSGTLPVLGSRVEVSWRFVAALFASIAGVHLTLAVAIVVFTKDLVVPKENSISSALVLRPLLADLHEKHHGAPVIQDIHHLTAAAGKHRYIYDSSQEKYFGG